MDESQTSELRGLLLHKLPASRAEELENLLLLDSEFGLCLESEENDLLDDFARGHLSAEDAVLVEKYFLATPDGQRRLEFAKSLSRVAASTSFKRTEVVRRFPNFLRAPVFAIGLAAILALSSLGIVYLRRQPTQTQVVDKKQTVQSRPASPSRVATPSLEENAAASFAIVLLNESRRGAEEKVYVIPPGVKRVQIQCEVPISNLSGEFGIVVRNEAGEKITNLNGLKARVTAGVGYVEGTIPSDQLKSGRYSASVYTAANQSGRIVAYDFAVKLSQN